MDTEFSIFDLNTVSRRVSFSCRQSKNLNVSTDVYARIQHSDDDDDDDER